MSRLIDADALIPKLKFILEAENQIYRRESWGFTIKCINEVKNAPIIEPEQHWIPVSERLPEEAQECWITAKDGTVLQGMFTRRYGERRDSGFICYGCGFAWLNAVAAWMPYELPEPYREEGD